MNIFVVIDKTKRNISLTQKQWNHICQHSEMTGELERIKEVLVFPHKIIRSPRDSYVHYYFQYKKECSKYLMVAVKYLNGEGFIITSFYSTKLRI